MPIYRIPRDLIFPNPALSQPSGLLGVGGDLSPARLALAYQSGIFPWYSPGEPILWWSPDPRMMMTPSDLHVPRSLKKTIRKKPFRLTMDTAFEAVIRACSERYRPGQNGTWITEDMTLAYIELHRRGVAHSIEAWQDDKLVGGLYGVSWGRFFAGESMFALVSDASKVAYVCFIQQLARWGFELVDCQVRTEHLARFGAKDISREVYLDLLKAAIQGPTRPGPWRFDEEV